MCKLTYYTGSINWILREYEEGYYNLHELQEEIEYHLEFTKGDTDISPQEHLILNCFRRMLKAIVEKESDKL
jgi:hypothetical protein